MEGAKKFGIAFKVEDSYAEKLKAWNIDLKEASGEDHQILPVPSVFIADPTGKILFVYTNVDYTVRIDNEALLEAVKQNAAP